METKLKFKVGDKVRVKSLEWYNGNKDANGLVYLDKQGIVFSETMANLCGKIVQIEEVNRTGYFIKEYAGFWQVLYFQHTGININKFVFFDFLKKVSHLCVKICEEVAGKRGYDPNKSADIKTAVKIFINRLFKYGENERRSSCVQNEQK